MQRCPVPEGAGHGAAGPGERSLDGGGSRVTRVRGLNATLLGFDAPQRVRAGTDGYPPYNVELIGETGLRITVAVAGFDAADLSVAVEGDQLVVSGRHGAADERVYLHRAIAARSFRRNFVLAPGIQVSGARLENGLLAIDLSRPLAGVAGRTIPIGGGERSAGLAALRCEGDETR